MKPKMLFKITVDFIMTVLLLLLMAKQITGNTAHEWLGAGKIRNAKKQFFMYGGSSYSHTPDK